MIRAKKKLGEIGVDDGTTLSARRSINVFLCHNNRDKLAVKAIADAIELDFGIPHFLDAYAIPVGEAFIPWIERALAESSGCAIFLGASGWGTTHLWEAELALSRARKNQDFRLIPVVLPGLEQSDTTKLGSGTLFRDINWANFSKGLDDVEALEKFRSSLTGEVGRSDRGPARLTPYQIRRDAARWIKAEGSDKSVLYRGKQLVEAEKLSRENVDILAVGDVVAFLQESVRRQSRVRRLMTAGLITTATVIAISVAVGIAQYIIADQRRVESESRRLALLARDVDGADGQILTIVQAYRQSPTVEASRTLREQLSKWQNLERLINVGQTVEALAVVGPSIFAGLEDGTLLKIELSSGKTIWQLADPGHHGRITALLATGGAGDIWIGREDGSIDILRRADSPIPPKLIRVREPPSPSLGRNSQILKLTDSSRQGFIVVGTGSGEVFALNNDNGRVQWHVSEDETTQISALALDGTGTKVLYGTQQGVLVVLEATSGKFVESIPGFEGGLMLIAPRVEGEDVLALSNFGLLKRLIPSPEGYLFRETVQMPSLLTAAVANTSKGWFALGDGNGNLHLRESVGGAIGFDTIKPHRSVVRAVVTAGPEGLVSASDDGTIAVWSLLPSGVNAALPMPPADPSVLRIDAEGRMIAVATKAGQAGLWVLDGGTWRQLADLIADSISVGGEKIIAAPPDTPSDAGFVPLGDDEVLIAATNPSATKVVWITRAGGVLARDLTRGGTQAQLLGQLPEESFALALNAAGTEAAVALKDKVYLYEVGTLRGAIAREIKAPSDIRSLAFHPDGSKLALGLEDGRIAIMRSVDGVVTLVSGRLTRGPAGGIGYDASGKRVIVNGVTAADRRIIVVDSSKLTSVVTLQVRQAGGSISAQALSVANNLLVTGDLDGQLIIWDLKNLNYVESIGIGGAAISALGFDDTNNRLIASSTSSGLVAIPLQPAELVSQLCSKIGPGIEVGIDFSETLNTALPGCS
jgi:WD40 repeat protein